MNFEVVSTFENKISEFFGSKYAIAVDSCTHGLELCLRYTNETKINVPKRTYLSVPFLAEKIGLEREWRDDNWERYYNEVDYLSLKKMSYDGRIPNVPWRDQDIDTVGFHYYMTPETAKLGLDKLQTAIDTPPRQWVVTDWPDLTEMQIFKK